MAAAFGLELHVLEREIVGLIEEGQIKARVDSQNKVRWRFLNLQAALILLYFRS
jgi:hypothetical protein